MNEDLTGGFADSADRTSGEADRASRPADLSADAEFPTPEEEAALEVETQRIRQIIDSYAAETTPDPERAHLLEGWVLRVARAEMLRGPKLELVDESGLELTVLVGALKHRVRNIIDAHPQSRARSVSAAVSTPAEDSDADLCIEFSLGIDVALEGSAPQIAQEIRRSVGAAIAAELGVPVSRVDVLVGDLLPPRSEAGAEVHPSQNLMSEDGPTSSDTHAADCPQRGTATEAEDRSDEVAESTEPAAVVADITRRTPGIAGLSPSLRDRFEDFVRQRQTETTTVDLVYRGDRADLHLDCQLDGSRSATAIAREIAETVCGAVTKTLQSDESAHAQRRVSSTRVRMRITELGVEPHDRAMPVQSRADCACTRNDGKDD
ncbi:hypothetical protein [Brevibacterium gallinarum]|uniref:Asp23/Gls24 family envelope stress response protein n=1 Tax=Brevibacterium gallinarum TaxID=2762220 RepID=A0ABR8WSR1_9MICO|nr:hypothetical protein [Brevibacterium gallinarum]MBD8019766.1 hypothetical protein [Brevibacterium gallinarum]